MSTFLKIVRYFFAIIFIFILIGIFFAGLPLTATTQTFVNRDNVKGVLNSDGVYDNVVDTFLTSMTMVEDSTGENDLSTMLQNDPEFLQNIDAIITSDETKVKVDTVIDAFYDWLEGKTTKPEFEVYLIDDPEVFKDVFTSVLMLKFQNLPTCSSYSYEDITENPLEASCIPPYVDLNELRPILEDSISSDQSNLEEIMGAFKFNSDQLNITQESSILAQGIYKAVSFLPIILIISVFILTTIIILLIPGFKGGFITTSIIYILIGLFYLIAGLLGRLNGFTTNVISMTNVDIPYAGLQDLLTAVISPLWTEISSNLVTYSLITVGSGIVLLIIGIVIKKKNKKVEEKVEPIVEKEKTEEK